MQIPTLIVMAAGLGSRYKGPKQLATFGIGKETLLEYALYDALHLGLKKVVFIINQDFPEYYKSKLKNILRERHCQVHFIEQKLKKFVPESFYSKLKDREKPLGTGHAIYCAREVVKEPFITLNADDFYGLTTFRKAFEYVASGNLTRKHHAMVAFQLKKTLSPNGSVARGDCQLKQGFLKSVIEFKKIEAHGPEIFGINEQTQTVEKLNPNNPVSMNFWILHPVVFELIAAYFLEFLTVEEDLSQREFYLPAVIDKAIRQQKIQVRVLETPEHWCGLTYKADTHHVEKRLRELRISGRYPEELWSIKSKD